jgi:transposase-like protein
MSVEEQVKSHTWRVEAGMPVRYAEGCPYCPNSESFHVHDCRARTFRLIVEGYVKIVRSGIWRWLCARCRRRFTDYPRLPCRTNAL